MSYLLEILGQGLLGQLSAAFCNLLRDDGVAATSELETLAQSEPKVVAHHRRFGVRMLHDAQA